MEKEELNQIVASYVYENITPLKNQRIRIKKLYRELRDFLDENKCFQTGSYARHTSIRPVNDLDVFYLYKDTTSTDYIGDSLSELHKNIKENFGSVCSEEFETEIQTHSVKIQFPDGFSIDVVPAIETGKVTSDLDTPIYKVPVEDTGEWVLSDPKGYKEITKTTDEISDQNFRRAVKLIKGCRKSCKEYDDDFKLKSFHIEQILTETFKEDEKISLIDSVKKFYTEMPANLLSARFIDRADNSIYTDRYVDELTPVERDQIINWSKNKLSQVVGLESTSDKEEAEAKLVEILSCSSSDFEDKSVVQNNNSSSFTPSGQHLVS